jgi:hypothetical protein
VFCREGGTPLDRWQVRKEFQKITGAARLGGAWTPRELRHSFVLCVPRISSRALLATLLAVIPKARRHGLHLLVTPDTVLRWHRDIVRRRWAARSLRGKTGRPAIHRNIKALILRLAGENRGWG